MDQLNEWFTGSHFGAASRNLELLWSRKNIFEKLEDQKSLYFVFCKMQ